MGGPELDLNPEPGSSLLIALLHFRVSTHDLMVVTPTLPEAALLRPPDPRIMVLLFHLGVICLDIIFLGVPMLSRSAQMGPGGCCGPRVRKAGCSDGIH